MSRRRPEEVDLIRKATRGAGSPSGTRSWGVSIIAASALLLGVLVYMFSEVRAYAGSATADDVHELCLRGTRNELGRMNGKDAQFGKALAGGMLVEMCSQMKEACELKPASEDCSKARSFVRVMARSK